ncbi:shikimate kinase [Candidatus Bathyarchaeota archaeon]|jgi:shikimate kinase|nr:shikimate kinase [Candidatus Bathyarchaeota archaeon]MBT4320834.1 shikimate kinase [Candidatus Bathyarchaeota archaeon]MBT4423108.1 shikimate kinase [Candidatus Bathyarchaeota archaeon]MBT5642044.1 shikimate kinase [Candidatus Bathyarchaeota archaeon]MBT6605484.1 shikimate kinase [Candidatus Bathyarchaeota archaeon]
MNVAVYGFMGVGKTTSGALLAEALGYEFIDMDEEIEKRTGKTIPEIFSEDGETRFRELERDLVMELAGKNGYVIGCGGGALADLVNAEALRETSTLVYLTASVDEILDRTGKESHRPLLKVDDPQKTVEDLIKKRSPVYERYAEIEIDTTGKSAEAVAQEIRRRLP